jgi:hypothetical protein
VALVLVYSSGRIRTVLSWCSETYHKISTKPSIPSMKTISILPIIALFGLTAVSADQEHDRFDKNLCEYFGMKKEWCVDGAPSPEFFSHLGDSSVNRHAPGSKRDYFQNGYEWPDDDLMSIHELAEFEKRSDSLDLKPRGSNQVPKKEPEALVAQDRIVYWSL